MAACDQVDWVRYLIAVESLLPPATRSTSAGRSTRRSATGLDGTKGSWPGTSRRKRSPSLRPNQSRNESKAVMARLSHERESARMRPVGRGAPAAGDAAGPSSLAAAFGTAPIRSVAHVILGPKGARKKPLQAASRCDVCSEARRALGFAFAHVGAFCPIPPERGLRQYDVGLA